mgnify:FL=1
MSSEALEEESTDSDVKVGVLDEGVKDLNADMGLENTVSLYALGEEVWMRQMKLRMYGIHR